MYVEGGGVLLLLIASSSLFHLMSLALASTLAAFVDLLLRAALCAGWMDG